MLINNDRTSFISHFTNNRTDTAWYRMVICPLYECLMMNMIEYSKSMAMGGIGVEGGCTGYSTDT